MKESIRDQRIDTDADFIVSKKYNNSLSTLLQDYPDGVPDRVICKVLQLSLEDFKKHYKCDIITLKETLK